MKRALRGDAIDTRTIAGAAWRIDRAGEALGALAGGAGLATAAARPGTGLSERERSLPSQLKAAAGSLELQIESIPLEENLFRGLRRAAPAILPTGSDPPGLLALSGWKRGAFVLELPDGGRRRVDPAALMAALGKRGNASLGVLDLLAGQGGQRRRGALAVMTEIAAEGEPLRVWRLGRSEGTLLRQSWREGVLPLTLAFLGSHLVQYLLFLQAWVILGRESLRGSPSAAGIGTWGALLAGVVLFQSLTSWLQGRAGQQAAHLLRRKGTDGILAMDPERIRHQGAGELLGRVIDAETVQDLAVTGGLVAMMSFVELAVAGTVLAIGPGGTVRTALLAVWFAVLLVAAFAYLQTTRRWTDHRHELTHRLVERMVGHRTRLAQQSPEHWHDGEEAGRRSYLGASVPMDRFGLLLRSGMHRGWMVIGVASVALVAGTRADAAVAVGGILLAFQAFQLLALGVAQLAGAAVAWRGVGPLLRHTETERLPIARSDGAVVEAVDLTFKRPNRDQPILRTVNLVVERGDRILLEGRSGSGKSTLGTLMAGLKEPTGGTLVRHGQVVLSPQFHQNHLMLAPLTFNLLMGRHWPATEDDVEEIRALCTKLGLGPLLARMPAGLAQMVGETGWRLSHGERSLVFVARTILERPDLVLLDESFGSLDPLTLAAALPVVVEEAPALLVIRQ